MKTWSLFFAVVLVVPLFAQPQSPIKTESPTNGRYQLFVNPNVRADTLLLDTQTGKIWRMQTALSFEGDPTIWLPEERIDTLAEYDSWAARHTLKAGKSDWVPVPPSLVPPAKK
jgi:hypothetical protein